MEEGHRLLRLTFVSRITAAVLAIAIALMGDVEACATLGGNEDAGAVPADDSEIHTHSCRAAYDPDSDIGFVETFFSVLTDVRTAAIASPEEAERDRYIDERIAILDCSLETIATFRTSKNPAVARLATQWWESCHGLVQFMKTNRARLSDVRSSRDDGEEIGLEATWKMLLAPARSILEGLVAVTRSLRAEVESQRIVLDTAARDAIRRHHVRRVCDPDHLRKYNVPADDSLTKEACALLRSLQ